VTPVAQRQARAGALPCRRLAAADARTRRANPSTCLRSLRLTLSRGWTTELPACGLSASAARRHVGDAYYVPRWQTLLHHRPSAPQPHTCHRLPCAVYMFFLYKFFATIRRFHATKRLALAIVPQHSATSHTPTALNCLFCCCLLPAFLLVLLVPCILRASFCTLEYATQNLQTLAYTCHTSFHIQRSRTLSSIAPILRRKHPCVFLVPRLTSCSQLSRIS
jgi:hypothetical protein